MVAGALSRGFGGEWRVVGGFEEWSYGGGRGGLGFDAAEAFEGAGVGGGVVAAGLARGRVRDISLPCGWPRRPEGVRAGGRFRRGAFAVPTGLWSGRRRGRWIRGGTSCP